MKLTSTSVLLIVKPKYRPTLAASHELVSHGEYANWTDGRTDGQTFDRYITFCTR